MIELPESYTIAKQLQHELVPKTVASVATNQSPHKFAFFSDNVAEFPDLLVGRTVTKVDSLAGYIRIQFDQLFLVLSEGLQIRYFETGAVLPQKHQLLIGFEDGSSLTGSALMYGAMFLFEDGTFDNSYYLVAGAKPTPYDAAFDEAYFLNLINSASPKLSVKAFLATEQRIPGLGNGCLQDILLLAHLHPKQKITNLTEEQKSQLFHSVKETLAKMRDAGGRDTEKDIYGNPGGYTTLLSKNTYKAPCPLCGHGIVKTNYLGGTIYYCEECQK